MYTPINIFSKISKGDEISLFAQPVIHSSFHLAWSLQLQIKLFSLILTLRIIAIKQQSMSNIMVYTMIRYPVR